VKNAVQLKSFEQTVADLGLSGYSLVHQSGHQNVFCDGKEHAWTNGGYTECSQMNQVLRTDRCDCQAWKKGIV
jgi:hypothetical protein